jgi:hypothetical protein
MSAPPWHSSKQRHCHVKGDTAKISHYEFSAQRRLNTRKNACSVKNSLLDVKMQEQVNRELTAAAWPKINGAIGTTPRM